MSGKDLLDVLGKKSPKQSPAVDLSNAKTGVIGTGAVSDELEVGEKLTPSTTETTVSSESADQTDKTVKNPDDWSKDSALKEVVKLREENKAVRVKFQEQLEKLERETEVKVNKIREEAQTALEAKKRLEALEAEQADKKRTIEEKLANREARLAELETDYKHKLEEKERELATFKTKATQYEAEQEARRQVYRDRIKEELGKVPEEFRSFADKMVKGYDDPQEAWLSLAEAQRMGMFGEKKIIVNHSVPGAADGARVTQQQLEAAEREKRKNMSSQELIRAGLAQAKQGKNNAYRGR